MNEQSYREYIDSLPLGQRLTRYGTGELGERVSTAVGAIDQDALDHATDIQWALSGLSDDEIFAIDCWLIRQAARYRGLSW